MANLRLFKELGISKFRGVMVMKGQVVTGTPLNDAHQ